MPRTKRVQVLMDPEEHAQLEKVARRMGLPVAELMRNAVRERYLLTREERRKLVDRICSMNRPVIEWQEVEEASEEGHSGGLS
jgi:hypothetical protein